MGEVLLSLKVWGYKCPSQQLQERPPLIALIRHPGRVNLVPYHKVIVLGYINDVTEDAEKPAGSHPPVTLRSNHLVQVVHASLVVVQGC